jgi:thioredoxin 1
MPLLVGINSGKEILPSECACGPVIIKFTAEWCKPCKQIQPLFEEIASRYEKDGLMFVTSDVDIEIEFGKDVRSLPTFVFLLDGVEIEKFRTEGSNNILQVEKNTRGLAELAQQTLR